MGRKKKLFILNCILVFGLLISGCFSTKDSTDDNRPENISELTIGNVSESSGEIWLKNETEQNIISISAWPVGGKVASDYIFGDGNELLPQESIKWYLPELKDNQNEYYIQIIIKDGTNFILRNINLSEIEDGSVLEVHLNDGVGYAIYIDSTGKEVNTFEAQKAEMDQPLIEDFDDENAVIGIPVD